MTTDHILAFLPVMPLTGERDNPRSYLTRLWRLDCPLQDFLHAARHLGFVVTNRWDVDADMPRLERLH